MGPDFLSAKSFAKVRFFFHSTKKTFTPHPTPIQLTLDNDYLWLKKIIKKKNQTNRPTNNWAGYSGKYSANEWSS